MKISAFVNVGTSAPEDINHFLRNYARPTATARNSSTTTDKR